MELTKDRTIIPGVTIRALSKVILIEDEPKLRAILVQITNAQPDLKVVGRAGDGIHGFEIFKRLKPDIVVTNIGMPGMNGIILTRKIIQIEPKVKIMIVSGRGLPRDIQFGLQAGASVYLTKPVSIREFLKGLRTVANEKSPRQDPWG